MHRVLACSTRRVLHSPDTYQTPSLARPHHIMFLQAPIVIITGASLRFSGGICSLGALHAAGMAGRELHREAPFPRFDAEAAYSPDPGKVAPGQVLSKFGTYVASVHAFDAAAFGLSPSEASLMDPQSRLLLEESCTAVVHSGRYSLCGLGLMGL